MKVDYDVLPQMQRERSLWDFGTDFSAKTLSEEGFVLIDQDEHDVIIKDDDDDDGMYYIVSKETGTAETVKVFLPL